jgi:hypothetical protein
MYSGSFVVKKQNQNRSSERQIKFYDFSQTVRTAFFHEVKPKGSLFFFSFV